MAQATYGIADFTQYSEFKSYTQNNNGVIYKGYTSAASDSDNKSVVISGLPAGSVINWAKIYFTVSRGTFGGTDGPASGASVSATNGGTTTVTFTWTSNRSGSYPATPPIGQTAYLTKNGHCVRTGIYVLVDYTVPTAASIWGILLDSSTTTQYRAANGGLTLSWSAANGTNNSISSYSIWYSDDGAGWAWLGTAYSGSYTVYAHPTAGHNRRFLVQAIAPHGSSSQEASPYVYSYSAPTAPSTITINPTTVYTNDPVALTFSGAANGVGVGIASYNIYQSTTNPPTTYLTNVTSSPASLTAPAIAGTYYYRIITIGNVSGYNSGYSEVVTLTVINPTSSFTLDKSTIQLNASDTITCTITPADPTYTHVVTWTLTGATTETDTLGTSVYTAALTGPTAWQSAIPSAVFAIARCTVTTKNSGGTTLGSLYIDFTVTIPSSVVPTVSIACAPNSPAGFSAYYIQGKSTCTCTITRAGAGGSTISTAGIVVNGGGSSGTGSPWTTPVLSTPGTFPIALQNRMSVTVTDSRGRTASASYDITVVGYNAPIIEVLDCFRADSSGIKSNVGTYASIKVLATKTTISTLNNIVALTIKYRAGAGSWSATTNLTNNTATVIGSGLLVIAIPYEMLVTATDTIGSTTTTQFRLNSSTFMFDFRNDKAALGRPALYTKTFLLPDDWTTNINADKLDNKHASDFALGSHTHGYITALGRIGTDADKILMTTYAGEIEARTFQQFYDVTHLSNTNLLHNWDFQKPVNQRGVSGVISTPGYFYDRWILVSGSINAYISGGTLIGTLVTSNTVIEQRLETTAFFGHAPVTISLRPSGSVAVYSGTGMMPQTVGETVFTVPYFGTMTLGRTSDYIYVRFSYTASGDMWFGAVKLEYNSISTLAYDPPADYGVELHKCQRYFYSLNTDKGAWKTFCIGHTTTSWNMYGYVSLPTAMRIRPTASWGGTISLFAGGMTGTNVTALTVHYAASGDNNNNIVGLYITHGGNALTDNQMLRLMANSDVNAYINLSADL